MSNINKFRSNIQSHIKEQLNDWMNAPDDIVRQSYYQVPIVASTLIVPRAGKIREFTEEVNNDRLMQLMVHNVEGEAIPMKVAKDLYNMDAIIVHYDNKIRAKYFAENRYENVPHLLQSTAKSLVGISYGIAVDKKLVDPEKYVTDYLPELKGTMYEDATIQQLADMRVNTPCNDFYSFKHEKLPTGDSVELMELSRSTMYAGWLNDTSIIDYAQKYIKKGAQNLLKGHGATFNYFSLDTILMCFVIEAATDEPFHEFFGREVYSKIGAAHDALFTINRFGEPTGGEGGMSVTAMDMLRIAKALQDKVFDSPSLYNQINFLREDTNIDEGQTNMAAFEKYLNVYRQYGMSHYSNFFYLAQNPHNQVRMNLMIGIYGQIVLYSLEDDFIYVGQSSYNVTTAPPIIAHIEAAYQLHHQLTKMNKI